MARWDDDNTVFGESRGVLPHQLLCVAGSQQPSFIAATLRGRGGKWIRVGRPLLRFALVGLFFVLGKGCFTGRDVFRHEKGGTCRLVRGIHGCSKKRSAAAMAMI